MNWLPISQLPESYLTNRKMFVVIAKDYVYNQYGAKYTTDPYCVWYEEKVNVNRDEDSYFVNHYIRWPHTFEPTHFLELPDF